MLNIIIVIHILNLLHSTISIPYNSYNDYEYNHYNRYYPSTTTTIRIPTSTSIDLTNLKYYHYNENGYFFTTIYRITNMSTFNDTNVGFKNRLFYMYQHFKESYIVELHSKINEIPINDNFLVLQLNENEYFNNGLFQKNDRLNGSYNLDKWEKKKIDITGNNCEHEKYDVTTTIYYTKKKFNENYCYNVLQYYYKNDIMYNGDKKITFFNFNFIPNKDQTCLTIMYIHTLRSYLTVKINILSEDDTIYSNIFKKYDNITTMVITNINLIKDKEYTISFEADFYEYEYNTGWMDHSQIWFGLLKVAQCSNNDGNITEYISVIFKIQVHNIRIKSNKTLTQFIDHYYVCLYRDEEYVNIVSRDNLNNVYYGNFNNLGHDNIEKKFDTELITTHICLNGGYTSLKLSCVCPPGFMGQFCEIGCGPNFYGDDCSSLCSMHPTAMCRGMYICTKYGCTCPAGLTGQLCNIDCETGKYGANCEQSCSINCHNNECNRYTGVCTHGCSSGYIEPYCIEKYPYLIKPPTVFTEGYEAIDIILNFQSDNIKGGNKNIKPKYYQLYYKPLLENTLIYSDFKLINETNLSVIEVVDNLEPDTEYTVGVLIITDDGNFNKNDIVFGTYRTSCTQPQITDYNIHLISGYKSVNISWNNNMTNRKECNIIEYEITLTFNQLHNKISGIQKIITHSNSGHLIDDLYPGYKYSVTLTPKTIKGSLNSSPVYSFTPLITGNDTEILNVVAFTVKDTIKVSWKLRNSQRLNVEFNEPVLFSIRYKINRILSCSLEEVETNWTSITIYNRTTYEIFDVKPNSQYSIQVVILNKYTNIVQRENMVYTLTPPSLPETIPVWDHERPILVTNNSVFVQWNVDAKNCSYFNGFFSKFYITLKSSLDNSLQVNETKQNYIIFNNLNANTTYELKIFIVNHIGYNNNYFLFRRFTTKQENLKPVDNFSVYKKSIKNRMVGIRWSYVENTYLNGFLVSFNEGAVINTNHVSIIPPTKCTAWPEYYCYTFYNLTPSNNYGIKIQPMSLDYPEGGKASSVSFNSIDGLPDPPTNLKLNDIGNSTINLQWDIPWIFNGILKMFILNVEETSAIDMDTCCISTEPVEILFNDELPTYNYTLTNLKPGSTYSVGVVAVSKSLWFSSPARISVTTPISI